MGRKMAKVVVTVTLSNHNSEQDERDALALSSLTEQIEALATAPQFREISPDVSVEEN